ncbi:MAG: hypothetical protein CL534_11395 [Ahrensia sp.]|nr:hypothetical protein [Ahrensia sp.]
MERIMSSEFEDIKIVSFDEKASGPSGFGSLMKLILRLSAVVPSEWADFFNLAWQRHIYMMKRDVAAYGDAIEILCAPDELESDHLPEIKGPIYVCDPLT